MVYGLTATAQKVEGSLLGCSLRYSACLFVAKALAIGFSQIGAYLGFSPKYFASTF